MTDAPGVPMSDLAALAHRAFVHSQQAEMRAARSAFDLLVTTAARVDGVSLDTHVPDFDAQRWVPRGLETPAVPAPNGEHHDIRIDPGAVARSLELVEPGD